MTTRARWALIVLVLLAWWTMPAAPDDMQLAMPPLIAAVAYAVAAYAGYITVVQAAIMIAVTVYGAVSGREAARRARNQARDAYNNSLADRTVNIVSTEAPWQIIYGEAVVGGAIVAQLTSGDKDQYKHVVIVWAAHECDAITDLLVNGVSVGSLDSEGYVTGGRYAAAETDTVTLSRVVNGSGQISLGISNAQRVLAISDGGAPPFQLPGSECTLTAGTVQIGAPHVSYWAGKTVRVTVDTSQSSARLRVRHHLGTLTQTADAATMADCPGDWTASDRGLGLCYSIIKLDLNEREFQGGPPQFTARIRGRKLYDRRTGTTAWSSNNALCIDDFLQAEWGKRALSTQIVASSVQATANVCDEGLSLHSGEKRYTCNGAFTTDRNPDATLTELCQSMAGFVTYTGAWHLQAGAWTAPVMDLGDAENAGAVEGVAEDSANDAFNGVRGQFYDPDRFDQLTDYTPYQNEAFVAADGEALWTPLNFPFTNKGWRAANLARIHTERSRGMTLVVPCKRVALKLRVGHRVRYSNSLLGISLATFRVVKRPYRLGQPVQLTLSQDVESFYDELDDAPGALPSPAVYQPNPWVVDAVSGLAASSGTATLQLQSDGTVTSRVHVTVSASDDVLVRKDGALQVEYRRDLDTAWQRAPEASGTATDLWLMGLEEGQVYVIRARWRNGLGAAGDWRSTWVLHVGKTEAPAAVAGLSATVIPGAVRISWTECAEADYSLSRLRYGASWAAGAPLKFDRPGTSYDWQWPALGSYKIWAAHEDSTGNLGTPVSVAVTVDSSIYIGSSTITPSPGWLNSNITMNADGTINGAGGGGATLSGMGLLTFRVIAQGNSATGVPATPGIWRDGFHIGAVARSYCLGKIRRSDGVLVSNDAYDVWGDASQAAALAAALNATSSDYIVVVHGYDEPQRNRLSGGLPAAMYRCGASQAVFGSPQLKMRSAYVLIGIAGCGEGNGAEAYQGSVDLDPNAWVDVGFALRGGNIVGVNAAYTPRTLADYSYTGDLAATKNTLTRSTSAPSSPTDGDFWIDTSVTPNTIRVRLGSTWQLAGTYVNGTAQIVDDANLGLTALWSGVAGAGKPLDNAGRTVDLGAATGVFGARNRDDAPGEYPYGRSQQFKQADSIGLSSGNGTYCTLETIIQYTDDTGGPNVQYAYQGDKTWRRSALRSASSWGAWTQDLDRNAYTGSLTATTNNVTYSMSAPGSAVDGDIWVDLSTTPARIKLRVGGNWQSGATLTTNTNQLTDGAGLGNTAVWSQVSGSGRPADSATKNVLTRSTSAPSSPTDGDLWCDTSLTPNVWKVRLGGTWQPAASYVTNTADIVDGANLGLTAVWTGVTGSGKPADNATRNQVFFQDGDPVSSPGGVVDGAIWISSTKAWQRVSGAWQPYVGAGSVGTSELGSAAATDVTTASLAPISFSNIA